jgi:hypothetical protein
MSSSSSSLMQNTREFLTTAQGSPSDPIVLVPPPRMETFLDEIENNWESLFPELQSMIMAYLTHNDLLKFRLLSKRCYYQTMLYVIPVGDVHFVMPFFEKEEIDVLPAIFNRDGITINKRASIRSAKQATLPENLDESHVYFGQIVNCQLVLAFECLNRTNRKQLEDGNNALHAVKILQLVKRTNSFKWANVSIKRHLLSMWYDMFKVASHSLYTDCHIEGHVHKAEPEKVDCFEQNLKKGYVFRTHLEKWFFWTIHSKADERFYTQQKDPLTGENKIVLINLNEVIHTTHKETINETRCDIVLPVFFKRGSKNRMNEKDLDKLTALSKNFVPSKLTNQFTAILDHFPVNWIYSGYPTMHQILDTDFNHTAEEFKNAQVKTGLEIKERTKIKSGLFGDHFVGFAKDVELERNKIFAGYDQEQRETVFDPIGLEDARVILKSKYNGRIEIIENQSSLMLRNLPVNIEEESAESDGEPKLKKNKK